MKLKNAFHDEINESQNEDYGQFEEYCKNNPQPSLGETMAFAKQYMTTKEFAKEWQKFKSKGEF